MNRLTPRLAAVLALLVIGPACRAAAGVVAKPADVGMSSSRLGRLDTIVQEAVLRKDFPGAVLLVGRNGKTVYRKAFGESQWVPDHLKINADMIFDLASLTKPVATATSIMILVEQGRLSLDEKVKSYVPGFSTFVDGEGKPGEEARIWHLLTHTSGLPPYADAAEVEKYFGGPCTTEQLVGYISGLKKTDPPGGAFHYSCLGYITLAHILNKVTGQTIAAFSRDNIFKPLMMNHTFYTPEEKYLNLCVPTQVINGKPLRGVVHDPLARLQGGISGNAGLFSTADDLAVFAEMMLGGGQYKGVRILSPMAAARMTSVWPKAAFAGRGLGWDVLSAYSSNRGDLFGPGSYGHSGYTGTSIWIDPETRTYVIFLTNSVHPDDKGSVLAMRSRVANVVAASILDWQPGATSRGR
jgi:CubicO group peptidase (beta-lactamase class C family)